MRLVLISSVLKIVQIKLMVARMPTLILKKKLSTTVSKKLICSLLTVMILGACSKSAPVAVEPRYVKVFTIGNQSESNNSVFHGTVSAQFTPSLSFRIAGKIIEKKVEQGQLVKKGQVIATLDAENYKLSEEGSRAGLAAAKSNFVTQQANLNRYKLLLDQNFVSQAQYDTQKSQLENAKAQYIQAQGQLTNSNNQVKYTELKAPADGTISSLDLDVGQVVAAGQVVATMSLSGIKEVQIEIPESIVNNYKVGMPASIEIWAGDKTFDGVIRNIDSTSDPQTHTFTVKVTIKNPTDDIKYGMSTDIKISPLNTQKGLIVPFNTIYAKEGKSYVWLLDKSNHAKLIPVTIVETTGNNYKIKTDSLRDGDKIVSAGVNFVHDGEELKIYTD